MASAKLPTPDELRAVGRQLGLTLSDDDVRFFLDTMGGSVAAYHAIEAMADPMPPVKYPRTPGYRPQGAENKYNAWYYKSEVQGAPSGKLKGKRIALKDNVCLAGVPMMNGASSLEGYVPDVDATIVTRMLDAGGTILGKVHCEYFCFSGGSHSSPSGPASTSSSSALSATVNVKTASYTNALTGDARGLKIAVVKEGFGHPNSEADVDALVRKASATFKQLGARVDEVSIPLHLAGAAIWTPIAVEGATHQMLNGNAFGFNWKGLYVTSLIDAHSAWRQR